VVWGTTTIVSIPTLGLTTPLGAEALLGENATANFVTGMTNPIVTGPAGVGLVNGTANVVQTTMQDAFLGDDIDPYNLSFQFGLGFMVGMTTGYLDQASETSIRDAQQRATAEWAEEFGQYFGGTGLGSPNLPTSTTWVCQSCH
jgi:hypothetical protein